MPVQKQKQKGVPSYLYVCNKTHEKTCSPLFFNFQSHTHARTHTHTHTLFPAIYVISARHHNKKAFPAVCKVFSELHTKEEKKQLQYTIQLH